MDSKLSIKYFTSTNIIGKYNFYLPFANDKEMKRWLGDLPKATGKCWSHLFAVLIHIIYSNFIDVYIKYVVSMFFLATIINTGKRLCILPIHELINGKNTSVMWYYYFPHFINE